MPARPRWRADVLLAERGLAPSRERAQALILAGRVTADGVPVRKAGERLAGTSVLAVAGPAEPFASRAGRKLDRALDDFGIPVAGRAGVDVGASTGGFTDCLLQRGARLVYAVDVGHGQLDARLRADPRVVVRERTNARHLDPADFPASPDLAVVDVSFISLSKVLPAVAAVLAPPADLVALVKPQFEAGRGKVGRGGIVRDPGTWREVLQGVASWMEGAGFGLLGLALSALPGADGNREFFVHLRPGGHGLGGSEIAQRIEEVLLEAIDGSDRPSQEAP